MACCNAIIAFDASLYHVHIIKKNIYTSRLQLIKGMMHGSPYCSILEKIFSGKLCPNSGIHVFTCTFETNLKGSKDQTKETSIRTRVKVTNQTWGLRGVWNLFISFIKCKPHGKCWHWQEQDTTPGIGMDSVVCLKRGYPKFFCWILTHPLGLPFKGSVYGIVRYSNV